MTSKINASEVMEMVADLKPGEHVYIEGTVGVNMNADGTYSEGDNGDGVDGLTIEEAVEVAVKDVNDNRAKLAGQERIGTMAAAIRAMAAGPDDEGVYDEAKRWLWSAINYYCKTDTMYGGMTLEDWIEEGDWHFKTGKLPTAKQLAADYDAR